MSLAKRDLLFDSGMVDIKNQLEDSEHARDLEEAKLSPELKSVLLRAAPVYRRHWWPRHESLNQEWVRHLQPLLDRYGVDMRQALARIYEVPWPSRPIRVDAVVYANCAGAYTTLFPTRPTISTTDAANQGTAALEMAFHESSHAMMEGVRAAIDSAEKAATLAPSKTATPLHRDLWHEVLFYTSGELVAELAPGYIPYADKNGLWARVWAGADREFIEKDWKPHISGAVSIQAALTRLVNDLLSFSPGRISTPSSFDQQFSTGAFVESFHLGKLRPMQPISTPPDYELVDPTFEPTSMEGRTKSATFDFNPIASGLRN
ncbi:MAG: hypothetical protein JO356_08485 [Acidobacteria bacterium]|nr:hypothetical protein [Acidobacteriota bacterium]